MFDAGGMTRALCDPLAPLPRDLRVRAGADASLRFAVYRNNVVASLIDAMRQNFPATQAVVGEEFFQAMAGVYVRAFPPRSPLMHAYGEDFPLFLESFEPASAMPYLADVARLEKARTRAFHAADASSCDASRLASIPPGALAAVRLRLHPSCEILQSVHPVVTIWQMNSGHREPAPIDPWWGQDALIHRRGDEVCVVELSPGDAAFILALEAGRDFQDAAACGFDAAPAFELTQALAGLMSAGAITQFLHGDDAHD